MQTKPGSALVLWDVMSYPLPAEKEQCCSLFTNILNAVFNHSPVNGMVSIMAMGANDTPTPVIDYLCSGMHLIQEWKMVHAMRKWAMDHSAPATYLVISGNKALSSTLEKLHTRNYNILVAHPKGLPIDLAGIASCVWDCESLLRGGSPYRVCKEMVPPIFAAPQPKVGTFVLWDLRTCPFPMDEEKCLDVVDNIYHAVFANCSFTDMCIMALSPNNIPKRILQQLSSDVPLWTTRAGSHITTMINGLNNWAKSHPSPANIFVISGDAALSPALEKLHTRNYNILLAHPSGVHSSAIAASASRVLDFESLLCGNPPYIGSRAEEPSKQTPAATVRPKKKTKYLHQKKVRKPVGAY
ncbi:hypothetical protein OROMI_028277 [Orobanche minor]